MDDAFTSPGLTVPDLHANGHQVEGSENKLGHEHVARGALSPHHDGDENQFQRAIAAWRSKFI